MDRSRFLSAIFAISNVLAICVFFLPLFLNVDHDVLIRFVMPLSIVLVSVLTISLITFSHSQMTSKSLIAFSATACALGTLGRLLDFPAGASGMFFVVIVCGFALGSQFGQIVGMSSMIISAFLTGGLGPWLGYQAIALGLVGAAAGIAQPIITRNFNKHGKLPNTLFACLIFYSGLLGLLYGFMINWWSWPFLDYGSEMTFNSTATISTNLSSYLTFYLRTSLAWDLWAFAGNLVAMTIFGRHVITALLPARKFLNPKVEFVETENDLVENYLGTTS